MMTISKNFPAPAATLCALFLLSGASCTMAQTQNDEKLYRQRNTENLRAREEVKKIKPAVAGLDFDYNHILMDGQSLSVGADSKVQLSISPQPNTVMVGDSEAYYLNRKPLFSPLVSVEKRDAEPPVIGATRFLSQLYAPRQKAGSLKTFIASSVGLSGRSVEELSKGAEKDIYGRLVGAVQAGKTAAQTEGKSYGVAALLWVQGETNYNNALYDNTKDGYKTKLLKLRQDFLDDAIKGISGQPKIPAFVTYQTGAAYTSNRDDIAIGMAQWEIAQEVPDCYLATPVYPFTDYGGHLTSNGYRWLGAQFAKVLDKILVQRQSWKPLSPRKITRASRTIAIDFHVPTAPLVFDSPYVGRKRLDWKDKGFIVVDEQGKVPLASVRIVMDTIVEIVCARDTVGEVAVRYATKTDYDGNGSLRDSDPTVAQDIYEFKPDSLMLPDENLPELVGKPYPLANWCIAFNLKAE